MLELVFIASLRRFNQDNQRTLSGLETSGSRCPDTLLDLGFKSGVECDRCREVAFDFRLTVHLQMRHAAMEVGRCAPRVDGQGTVAISKAPAQVAAFNPRARAIGKRIEIFRVKLYRLTPITDSGLSIANGLMQVAPILPGQ